MIDSKLPPSWFFGAFATAIHTHPFNCFVSTSRNVLLWKRWSTRLYLGDPAVDGYARTYCTIIWAAHLHKIDVYQLHDSISDRLNSAGDQGFEWPLAASLALDEFRYQGIENLVFP